VRTALQCRERDEQTNEVHVVWMNHESSHGSELNCGAFLHSVWFTVGHRIAAAASVWAEVKRYYSDALCFIAITERMSSRRKHCKDLGPGYFLLSFISAYCFPLDSQLRCKNYRMPMPRDICFPRHSLNPTWVSEVNSRNSRHSEIISLQALASIRLTKLRWRLNYSCLMSTILLKHAVIGVKD